MKSDMDQEQSAKVVSTENQELQSALTKCQNELAQYVRELEIESALERVRARTMAMQHSSELADAAMLLFKQMQPLEIPAWSVGYCTWEDDKQAANFWMSSEGRLPKGPVSVCH